MKDYIRRSFRYYLFALTASVVVIALTALLSFITGHNIPFFFAIIAVTVSAWYGGIESGVFTTIVLLLANLFIFHTIFLISSNVSPLLSAASFIFEGVFVSFVIDKCIKTDKVRELESREAEYIHELRQSRQALKHAEEEIRARDEFLSIASHELKTPLTSMLLQLQTILHNIRNVSLANFSVERLMKMLTSAESQSKRLSKMINDLLNVSLITTGRMELSPETFDLAEVTKNVVESFSERMKREQNTIIYHHDGKIVGNWDKIRIEQALTNLIVNAIKYGDNKPITVSLFQKNSTAFITVADEGIGISPEMQEKIFSRFKRGVSPHDYEGLGVGLYITHQIIEAHHGTIKVKSKVGHGTTFEVRLPVHE